ncbi:MAG TPA: host attachment protein [Phycisphaerales bacterium]|nr:host attachment protein [Phycisphaerales bacterium]
MNPRQNWIIAADSRKATLFVCQRVFGGHLHVEQLESLKNMHEAEHERHRPTLGGGAERQGSIARSGAHAAPHAVAERHTAEEEELRFAREVGRWLDEVRTDITGSERLTIFAAPRFLGRLRDHVSADLRSELREGELSGLQPSELAVHPAVLKAVNHV